MGPMNERMVRAENPLKEGLGEGALKGPDGQKGGREATEWTRGCRRRIKSQGR